MRERRYPRTPIDTENRVCSSRFIVSSIEWDWYGLNGTKFGDMRTPALLGATLQLVLTGPFDVEKITELLGMTVMVKGANCG